MTGGAPGRQGDTWGRVRTARGWAPRSPRWRGDGEGAAGGVAARGPPLQARPRAGEPGDCWAERVDHLRGKLAISSGVL